MSTTYDLTNRLAPRPPMGWNSYNPFGGMHGFPADGDPSLPGGVALSERLILETADALVASGMRDAGYVYLNLDDRWQDPRRPRGADGRLQADLRRFPRGIKALADDIHARGLRFGTYTVANVVACGGEEGDGPCGFPRTGSLGHEREDAALFAEWGVDFLKIDWCGVDEAGNRGRAADIFATWNDAIAATGRDIVLSASTWGEEAEDTWAPRLAHMWRTTADLHASWDSILAVARANSEPRWLAACGPRRGWNDPDMMHVGHPALTLEESRTHLVLWAMMSAPLLAGHDVRTMSAPIRDLLLSPHLVALDGDASSPAAVEVRDDGWDVWRRHLSDGRTAVAAVNCAAAERPLPHSLRSDAPDLLDGSDSSAVVASHGARLTVA